MIYWFYGQPGAGKTTLGNALEERLYFHHSHQKTIRIDGDEMREIFQNKDYSEQGRRNNLRKVNDLFVFYITKDSQLLYQLLVHIKM